MNSTPIKSLFVVLFTTVLMVPLLGAGSVAGAVTSAFQPASIPYSGSQTGVLEPRPSTIYEGKEIEFLANFPSTAAGKSVTFYKESSPGSNNYSSIGTDPAANSSGNAYLNDYLVNGDQRVFAKLSTGEVTQLLALDAKPEPPLADKDNDVPTVHFNTNSGETVNTRDTWFPGEFSILPGTTDQNKDGSLENCGAVNKIDGDMRGRGNYSWSFAKKGFNLRFDDSIDLCGMGKSKKWALVANHYDRSLLRNSAAGFVGKVFSNLEWTPKDAAVDFYHNGSFRGSYILIERVNLEGGRIDRPELKAEETPQICSGPDPSVDTTSIINGTYLLEWDFRKGANFNFGANDHGWIGLKEPEDEDYCQNMGAYINDYVDRADRDLYDGAADSNDWMSSIDLASAVDYYIAMEFLKPVDGNMWASVYMYKPRGEKIHFGPLWDFDLAMGSANRAGNVVSPSGWYLRNRLNVSAKQTDTTWFNRMNQNPTFRAAVKTRWNQIDQNLDNVVGYVRDQENLIDKSASDNYVKWNHDSEISQYQVIKSNWGADVDYLASWLDKRWLYMNGQLDNND